jgi:hypothetical protein
MVLLSICVAMILICSLAASSSTNEGSWEPVKHNRSQAHLFEPSDKVRVIAPSQFPKPTRMLGDNVTVVVQPSFGSHRSNQNAIFAYAEGYSLPYYMSFLETLTATGYRGDVVLAIASEQFVQPSVTSYLKTFARGDTQLPNLVVYQHVLDCDGNSDHSRTMTSHGALDTFQMCRLHHVYGYAAHNNTDTEEAMKDPRQGRVVATLRYEWYWIWSLQYDKHSWLMLLDARDSFFQSDPFRDLPHSQADAPDGLLYFFGENADATRLGLSTKNKKWLENGYGVAVITALFDKPTICSGSTMGEAVAVKTYLRAMVNEHDEGNTRMTGSDQGFHNYLYYSHKLAQAETIRKIVVWEQGRGIINNLGALRTKPLNEWGILNPTTRQVYNWDGTLSPVVHQYDRDKDLHRFMMQKHVLWIQEWEDRSAKDPSLTDSRGVTKA